MFHLGRLASALVLSRLRPARNYELVAAAHSKLFQATHIRTGVGGLFRVVERSPNCRAWLMRDTTGRVIGPVWDCDLSGMVATEAEAYPQQKTA